MIRDFRSFDGGDEVACDICVVGAGAAGIAMALALAEGNRRVILLESGGVDFEPEVQDLYVGQNVGHPYFDLDVTRLRFLGGTTNHWGGMCAPLDERDFLARPWVPHSGWPIRRADLDPYYPRAHEILDIGPYGEGYSPHWLAPEGGILALRPDRLLNKLFRYSVPPAHLGSTRRAELEAAAHVEVWLHANLVDIELDEGGAVRAFQIANLAGKRGRVRAQAYVLAMGGIENPRILLNSDRVVPGGIGNQRDLVGRFFMEHPGTVPGRAVITEPGWEAGYQMLPHPNVGGHMVQHAVAPSDALMETEGILSIAATFGEVTQVRQYSPGYGALHKIKAHLRDGRLPDDLGQQLWLVLSDLGGIARGMRERFDSSTYIVVESEQAPNPDSRIQLNGERDALGLRRVDLDWRLSDLDHRTIRTFIHTVALEMGRLGVARVQLGEEWLGEAVVWPDDLSGANHHIGTTRMAADPSRGVVDGDCRVHGHDNLYIAGCSVFPTAGFANPTLTIVALALRLADHLETRLAGSRPAVHGAMADGEG